MAAATSSRAAPRIGQDSRQAHVLDVAADEPGEDEPADDAGHDAGRGNHGAFAEHAGQQVARLRADRQPDAELARPRAHRERQHAGHADDRDQQRHAGEDAEHQRVQPIRRQHFGLHVVERRRLFDRLLGRQVADDARDRARPADTDRSGCGRTGGRRRTPGPMRVIDVHGRPRHDVLVVDVADDADDAPAVGAHVDELHDRVGPHQVAVDRVLVREQLLRQALADDHDALAVAPIAVVEVAAGEQRHAERGEEARRDRPELRPRIVVGVWRGRGLRRRAGSRDRSCRPRATAPACPPRPARRRAARRCAASLPGRSR